MAEIKAPASKLWLIVYFLVALIIIGAGAYFFISRAQNSPEAVYQRALKTIGVGLERFTSPQIITQADNARFDGYLAIGGFSRQDGQNVLEPFGLYESGNPDHVSCFGQLDETNNQLRLEIGGNVSNPADGDLLGPTQVEADLLVNQSTVGGLELRIIPEDEPALLPPIYLMIDKTDCLEQLAAGLPLPADLLGTWWLIDTSELLGDQLGGELSSLLEAVELLDEESQVASDITQADVDEVAKIITDSLNAYLFTDDPEQMILQMTDSVDKQAEFDGQTGLYKYDVDINKANTIALLTELTQKINDSQLSQKLIAELGLGQEAAGELISQEDIDALDRGIDEFKQNNKIEIWINPKTKLLRNLRITDINPTSQNLGSTWDLGLMVSDEDEITIDIKATTFSAADQCQSTKNGLELSPDEYNQQVDCPYLLDPNQPPEEVASEPDKCPIGDDLSQADLETFIRCSLTDFEEKVYARSLKDNPTPHVVQSLQVKFSYDGQSLGFDYQLLIDGVEVSFGVEATAQTEGPVLAPPDARPLEELLSEISTSLIGPQRDASRQADVNQIAAGINQFVATQNALPTNWTQLEPLVQFLDTYQPSMINAADAWAAGSTAGEFIDLSTVGDLDQTQSLGGLKLAGDDADAPDHLMIFRQAACSDDRQSLVVGNSRQVVIAYKLEGQGFNCLDI